MSVLFWLFGLGISAIAFPIVFHLIRQQPKGQADFSSLMFLRPTPPRISRRSRIENWLLLLLRSLVILLIAAAFMRPFFPDTARLLDSQTVNRRIALLIDRSSSMRRAGVWEQVAQRTQEYLDTLEPDDQVALFAFDDQVETLVPFTLEGKEQDFSSIATAVRESNPSWAEGKLAAALSAVARQLVITNEENAEQDGLANLQIILVSDLQSPTDWQQIQAFQWPEAVKLDVIGVAANQVDDANMFVVPPSDDSDRSKDKLRISNHPESNEANYSVRWIPNASQQDQVLLERPGDMSIDIQIAPGMSQTVSLPDGFGQGEGSYQLVGDQDLFGNQFFAVNEKATTSPVFFLTDNQAEDPNEMLFYFQFALPESNLQKFELSVFPSNNSSWQDQWQPAPNQSQPICQSIFVNRNLSQSEIESVEQFVAQGGRCIILLSRSDIDANTAELAGVSKVGSSFSEMDASSSETKQPYLLLGQMNFQNDLLQPFRKAGFNDFTKIRFWDAVSCELNRQQETDFGPIKVVASYDNQWPAIWTRTSTTQQNGTIIGLAIGWQPDKSQFALSSKFVPLIQQLLKRETRSGLQAGYWAGQSIQLPAIDGNPIDNLSRWEQTKFDVPLEDDSSSDSSKTFVADTPGIYQAETSTGQSYYFAVNVNPVEYLNDQLDEESFSSVGVLTGQHTSQQEQKEINRQKRDLELEEGQKLWKWLIAAAMVLLVAEMCVAGRTAAAEIQLATSQSNP